MCPPTPGRGRAEVPLVGGPDQTDVEDVERTDHPDRRAESHQDPATVGSERGTIVAMSTEALRTVKDRLSEFVDRVQREHERVVITRNGTPAAVLISADDLEALEETLEVLSDKKAVKGLLEAEEAIAAGDVVRGVDAVRKLRGR